MERLTNATRLRKYSVVSLSIFVVLIMAAIMALGILSSSAHAATSPATRIPLCDCRGDIPDAAWHTYDYVTAHNYSPPPHYKGGKKYHNRDGKLPNGHGHYKEYHIYRKGTHSEWNRVRRIVVNTKTQDAWYTPDHYRTFRHMCVCEMKRIQALVSHHKHPN